MLQTGASITAQENFRMSEASEALKIKEAALSVHRYILSNFLYDMALGEKAEFMETAVYKAFFKEFVRANLEYEEARNEKVLHR